MKTFDWNTFFVKLTSRKFITMLCTLVSSILITFKVEEGSVTQITAIITAFLTALGYIICESKIDAAREGKPEELEEFEEAEE